MTRAELYEAIAKAIATMEGFYKVGSVAQKNNNPGNIRVWGQQPIEKGYVKFPTVSDGWKALNTQIDKNVARGLTFLEFFAGQRDEQGRVKAKGYPGYSPGADNNHPVNYAKFVAEKVGTTDINIIISSLVTAA